MTSRPQPDSATQAASGSKPETIGVELAGPPLVALDSAIFKDVQVALRARLGQVSLSMGELLALKPGSVVELDSRLDDLVELRLNDSLVARGEIVAVGDRFGVRIVDIARTS